LELRNADNRSHYLTTKCAKIVKIILNNLDLEYCFELSRRDAFGTIFEFNKYGLYWYNDFKKKVSSVGLYTCSVDLRVTNSTRSLRDDNTMVLDRGPVVPY
jgi:hypothetical protein